MEKLNLYVFDGCYSSYRNETIIANINVYAYSLDEAVEMLKEWYETLDKDEKIGSLEEILEKDIDDDEFLYIDIFENEGSYKGVSPYYYDQY